MGKIPELSECNPGLLPTEFNVLVLPAPVDEKIGSIILAEKTKTADEAAQTRGRLVAVSPLAFCYENWPEGSRRPEVGDVVIFGKYAGVLIEGTDKREYRAIKDKDVAAIVL